MTASGTGSGVVRLRIDPRAATTASTFLRLSSDDTRLANEAQLVPLTIVAGCPVYLPALER
jgi:hypothetical protein